MSFRLHCLCEGRDGFPAWRVLQKHLNRRLIVRYGRALLAALRAFVRSLSPRDSSMLVYARQFIDDEAGASDAENDEAGGENLDEFENDGFVVDDHESESEHTEPEAVDADEGVAARVVDACSTGSRTAVH